MYASFLLVLEPVHPDVPREEIPVIQHHVMSGHSDKVVSIGVYLPQVGLRLPEEACLVFYKFLLICSIQQVPARGTVNILNLLQDSWLRGGIQVYKTLLQAPINDICNVIPAASEVSLSLLLEILSQTSTY